MEARNERAPGERGARDCVSLQTAGWDSSTPYPSTQHELFGLVVGSDDRATTCAPCPECGATVATIGGGAGPHHAQLRCLRGHFLRWLPKPGGA